MINNKSIFISGSTGSFGSLFVNHIIKKYKPKRLIIFSRDELKQLKMREKISPEKYPFIRYFIGDIRDKERLDFALSGVDYVFHAAAMKQVDTSEYNPTECINTNIFGTQNLIAAAQKHKVKKFISISTDKAVNPINLYGATKLAADKLVVAANNLSGKNITRFSVVRYGNVVNSRGSVIPFFKDLIKNKKTLPITDKSMTRFLISLEQSANFVLQCTDLMRGGEIFVPKIPSAKLMDIVQALDKKAKTKVVGVRPGEKIHEILCSKEMSDHTLEFKNYYLIKPSINFFDGNLDYSISKTGEKGKKIRKDSEYSSDKNPIFLNTNQIRKLISN